MFFKPIHLDPMAEAGLPSSEEATGASDGLPNDSSRISALLQERELIHARELADRDRRASEWESAYKSALRERELATALSGRPLVPGAAAQLIKLWRDDFEVASESGEHRVRTRDGRGVEQAVDDWLSASEYAHFRQATTRGGATERGRSPAASPGKTAAVAPPRTLGEAVLQHWRESMERGESSGARNAGFGRRTSR
jgi:hypothetical protein